MPQADPKDLVVVEDLHDPVGRKREPSYAFRDSRQFNFLHGLKGRIGRGSRMSGLGRILSYPRRAAPGRKAPVIEGIESPPARTRRRTQQQAIQARQRT